MSRWDALKPTETQSRSRRRQQPAAQFASQQHWRSDNGIHHDNENATTTTTRRRHPHQTRSGGNDSDGHSVSNGELKFPASLRLASASKEHSASAATKLSAEINELSHHFSTLTNIEISQRTAAEALLSLAEVLNKEAGPDGAKESTMDRFEIKKKVLVCLCNILDYTNVPWSKLQASKVVTALSHACRSDIGVYSSSAFKFLCVTCLARTVKQCSQLLPSEESSETLVQQIFLPLLEESNTENETPLAVIVDVLVALKIMLQDPRKKLALLAPLVRSVTTGGDELSIENPLRTRIFRVLHQQLMVASQSAAATASTDYHNKDNIAIAAAECVAAALQAAVQIDGTSTASTTTTKAPHTNMDFQPAVLDLFLGKSLSDEASTELRRTALNLLYEALECRPESYSPVGGKYLFGNVVSWTFPTRKLEHQCSFCRYHSTSPLLDILHSSTANKEEMRLAISCCSKLIQVMPLKLRINATNECHGYSIASPLGSKIGPSLEYLIRVCHCQVRQSNAFSMKQFCPIIFAVLQSIPFHNSHQGEAVAAADLLAYLAEKLMDASTTAEDKALASDVIVASIGGKLTPQGTRTETTIPAQIWLSMPCFAGVFHQLLAAAHPRARTYDTLGTHSLKLIKALARVQPDVVMAGDRDWELLASIVQTHTKTTSASLRLEGLELSVNVLCGRKEQSAEIPVTRVAQVVGLAESVLRICLDDPSPQCRCACFQAYGALLVIDWIEILNGSKGDWQQLISILDHCSSRRVSTTASNSAVGELNASVRASACKAAGDICMTCLSQAEAMNCGSSAHQTLSMSQATELSLLVCQRMQYAVRDSNAGVKSMALFAFGNLAYAMRSHPVLLVPASDFVEIYEAVVEAIEDSNGKVCGNAIRTVGHVGSLALLHRSCLDSQQLDRIAALHLQTLLSLARKIAFVAEDDGGLEASLSWKQRSQAKKHGWGTCNSLALLLSFETFPDNDDAEGPYQTVLEVLVKCLELIRDIHEKIAIAAVGALKAIPLSYLPRISGRTGLVGRAICYSTIQVKELSKLNPTGRLLKEVDQLLQHLVLSITSFDAVSVISNVDMTKEDIEFLYSWMTENQIHEFSFQCFAIALQKSGWRGDAQLEHKFANPTASAKMSADDFEDEL